MALVMLPCDLPWWSQVQRHLNNLLNTKTTFELTEEMQKIYELCKYIIIMQSKTSISILVFCSISLDPEEDTTDPDIFTGLQTFFDNDMTYDERNTFFSSTLKTMVKRALNMKQWKPRGGLHFSLQQQRNLLNTTADLR